MISNSRVGNVYLCDTSLIKQIDPDFLPYTKTGKLTYEQCTFKSNNTTLFDIHLDFNGAISSIYVSSQYFKVANSIRVGMRLSKLVAIYPKLEIWSWHAGAYEHISIPDHPNIILGIKSDNGQKLGFYRKKTTTKKFRLDGEVAGIELLSNCSNTDAKR